LNNLRLLSDDKEALALAKYAEDRNEEVDIYVQHIPSQSEVVHFIIGPGIDLSNHTCTCYFWDLIGIPCRHVVAAINYKVKNPEAYVHPYYKRAAYEACYCLEITPINGQQLWPKSTQPELLSPIYKTPPGRPKKLRIREADEHVSHSKLSKKNLIMKCSRCKQMGHNIRSCKGNQA